ncbi:hypothetical protein D9757_006130 [Collybiopsis confluens]|uniref:Uncharacterized protein n=1 Tax=Collybiopsis confluens TaxID=2823264 RepID=A0A8H5M6V5_9AGAR|nr:hypothetical protein D9757_006130 [Collybiopsis confluens]
MFPVTFQAVLAALLLTSSAFIGAVAQTIPVAPAPWTLGVQEGGFLFCRLSSVDHCRLGTLLLWKRKSKSQMVHVPKFISPITTIELKMSISDDELIYVPGKWAYDDGQEGFRITNIYVTSNASVFNGRQNWNIPKHQANFEFQTDILGTTTVSVNSPGSAKPFFSASLLPTTLPIPIEVNTTLTGGYLNFLQPPIPAGDLPVEIGTSTWKQFLLDGLSSSLEANVIVGALPGGRLGDGVGYRSTTSVAGRGKTHRISDLSSGGSL